MKRFCKVFFSEVAKYLESYYNIYINTFVSEEYAVKYNLSKKALCLFLSLLSVLLFTGCSESNTQPESDPYQIESTISGFEPYVEDTSNYKIISYAVSTAPKTIDPKYVVASSMDAEYIYHTSEGLLRMYDGIVCPGIANTWEKVGNYTYAFHLRDARWEDGRRITADDFIYSYKRLIQSDDSVIPQFILEIENVIAYRAGNTDIENVGLYAPDSQTLEITLEEDNPLFLQMLAADTQASIVRKDILYACGDSFGKSAGAYLSCGPFRLRSWDDDGIVLERNPFYWNAKTVKIDQIKTYFVPDGATRAQMYDSGECNAYVEMVYSNAEKYDNPKTAFENTLVSLQVNFDNYLLENDNFRRAISYAIDRSELVKETAIAGAEATARFISPARSDFLAAHPVEEMPTLKADVEKAKEYLESALSELDTDLSNLPEIVFICSESPASKVIADKILEMLKTNLGLENIRVYSTDPQTAIGYYTSGNYDLFIQANTAPISDPIWQISRFRTYSVYNLSGFTSKTFDGLYDEIFIGEEEDYDALARAEELLIKYSPEIPLYFRGFLYGIDPSVSNIAISESGVKLQLLYGDVQKEVANP